MIITIDGKSGQRKSTIGQLVAQKLDFQFLSTGVYARYGAYQIQRILRENPQLTETEIIEYVNSLEIDHEHMMKLQKKIIREDSLNVYLSLVVNRTQIYPHAYSGLKEYIGNKDFVLDGRGLYSVFEEADLKYYFNSTFEKRVEFRTKTSKKSLEESIEYFRIRDQAELEIEYNSLDLIEIDALAFSTKELVQRICKDANALRK